MDALDDERRSPMVAVAAWWDRHGIMGVGEGRDPKLGAWCLVPVLPLSGPAVSWRVASARHRIDGGGVFGRDAGIEAGLEGCFFQRRGPAPQRPFAPHRMAPYRSGALRPMGACRMAHQN